MGVRALDALTGSKPTTRPLDAMTLSEAVEGQATTESADHPFCRKRPGKDTPTWYAADDEIGAREALLAELA